MKHKPDKPKTIVPFRLRNTALRNDIISITEQHIWPLSITPTSPLAIPPTSPLTPLALQPAHKIIPGHHRALIPPTQAPTPTVPPQIPLEFPLLNGDLDEDDDPKAMKQPQV